MKSFVRSLVFLLIPVCFYPAYSKGLLVSGELTDSDGNLIGAQTPYLANVVVNLYDTAQGGVVRYTETFFISNNQGISVKGGVFTVSLGEGTTSDNLASVVVNSKSLWIEIIIDGDVLSRAPVTASPYVILAPDQLHAKVDN